MTPPKQQRPEQHSAMHSSRTLTPDVEQITIGTDSSDQSATPARSTPTPKPVPLGTYVPPELKRAFKARCAELGIEMKDAATEALSDWLEKSATSEQASSPDS